MVAKKSEKETLLQSSDPASPAPALEAMQATMARFLDTASISRVYGEPVREGDTTIIPAAEVLVGMGFGFGYGGGGEKPAGENRDENGNQAGGGGGGGGGGRTLSRPVAVVIVSPDGVMVEPVVDVTKIAIASITAIGFMMATLLGILSPKQMVKQIKGE
jgi:uncharacterized spore protein YtfJ